MKTNSYEEYSTNVNFIKFIAAVMVIMSHAFPLSNGTLAGDWFSVISRGQCTMGGIAVDIFFFYSGLLIARSMERSLTAKRFFLNRGSRIIPPLMVTVVLSAFVLGPLVTTLPLREYFTDSGTYRYLLNGIFVLTHDLPGVFTNNIYLPTVNGSLWTLPVEVLCYVACYFLFRWKMNKKLPMKILIVLSVFSVIAMNILSGYVQFGIVYSTFLPVLLFFAGLVYYVFRDTIKMDWRYFILAVVVIIISGLTRTLMLGLYFAFPYILAFAGFGCKRVSEKLGKPGKISYGMYLCGFPIQQCIVWLFGGEMNAYVNMLLAIPLAMIGGWLLYEFVEKKVHRFIRQRQKSN
ncbi:MAG: acyltransferase [Bacteroidales bacterium]|nr:acyltransferase [Clostridium sp.]MCM1202914.1 acyltransferase [Bacteroidales bacterium]